MKCLSLVVLVASALLLIAASPSPQSSPSGTNNYYYSSASESPRTNPSPNPLTKGETEKPTQHDQILRNSQPPIGRAIAAPTRRDSIQPLANMQGSEGKQKKNQDWWLARGIRSLIAVAVSWLSATANTIFNGLLVLFTYLLYRVGTTQTKLLKATTQLTSVANAISQEISRESVKVAKLAVQSERPYLLVEKAELNGAVQRTTPLKPPTGDIIIDAIQILNVRERFNEVRKFFPQAIFTFRNYGKGAAIIKELVGILSLVADLPQAKDFSLCSRRTIERDAVGPGDPWVENAFNAVEFLNNEAALSAVRSGTKRLIVYGRLTYTDVSGTGEYETGFLWIFEPPKPFPLFPEESTLETPTIPSTSAPVQAPITITRDFCALL
jgi:hypothetical protein